MSASIGFLSSIKKLLNDYLDVTISSRASASDMTTLKNRLTESRAGYLDELAAANLPADIDSLKSDSATLLSRTTALTNLDASVSSRAAASTALSTAVWTSTKAGYIDTAISSRLGTLSYQEFTSSGTWVKPSNVSWVFVLLVGGGGGGYVNGSISAGGGGGQVVTRLVQVTGNVSVTIGAGGVGHGGSPGGNGGTSSFGSLVNAYGGSGGYKNTTNGYCVGGGNTTYGNDNYGLGSSGGAFGGFGGRGAEGQSCPGYGKGGSVVSEKAGGGGSYGNGADGGSSAAANSGGGGGGGVYASPPGNGGSGYCIVFWIQ